MQEVYSGDMSDADVVVVVWSFEGEGGEEHRKLPSTRQGVSCVQVVTSSCRSDSKSLRSVKPDLQT